MQKLKIRQGDWVIVCDGWHAQEEDRFLRKLADRLDAAVNVGQAKSLILIAPPARSACYAKRIPIICAPRCAPRSTRISSSFPCTRSRGISRGEQGGRRGPSRLPHLHLRYRYAAFAGCFNSLSALPDRIASPSLPSARRSLTKSRTAARSRISCG